MGIISFGVPVESVKFFIENMELNIFVEGGTHKGKTAQKMSLLFNKVYTIEKSEVMYEMAKENLYKIANIECIKGDTRDYLHKIITDNDNILFWLDAHWSGGETYGKDDECPLLEELSIIFRYDKNYVIFIDDARLFLSPPPLPHDYTKWPTIKDIIDIIPDNFNIMIFEDVIYIYHDKIKRLFNDFSQQIATLRWKEDKKETEGSFKNCFKIFVRGVMKWKS